MHDILLILGTALLAFASTRILTRGGVSEIRISPALAHQMIIRLEKLNMALPDILAVVADLEAGVANVNTEVVALIAKAAGDPGSISSADADALQARLEGLRAAVAAIPVMPS